MPDDKALFDENSELDDTFGQHLRYLYNTKSDDRQSLSHIRERLLKNSQEALPAAHNTLKDTAASSQERQLPPELLYRARPTLRKKSLWPQRAVQLVAMLLIVVITGAFVLVMTVIHTSSGGNIPVRPGWEQIAVYSGKGDQTITGIKRTLPQIWASSITCTGKGAVDILISGTGLEDLGTDSCKNPELTLSQPTTFSYNESSAIVIQMLKVTAQANTSWQLHLLQAIKQPNWKLGSEWKWAGTSRSGKGITFGRSSQNDNWVRQATPTTSTAPISVGEPPTSAQSWAIITICFGQGKSHLQLSPDVGYIPMPICDGQPRLTVLRFPTSTTLYTMTVSAEGDIMWSVQMASCINEAKCKLIPAQHVTPISTTQSYQP